MRGGWRRRIKVAAQNGMAFSRAVVELKHLEARWGRPRKGRDVRPTINCFSLAAQNRLLSSTCQGASASSTLGGNNTYEYTMWTPYGIYSTSRSMWVRIRDRKSR
jgi:hypothetical protein